MSTPHNNDKSYPVLQMPYFCLENVEGDTVYLDVSIKTRSKDGVESVFYSGYCQIEQPVVKEEDTQQSIDSDETDIVRLNNVNVEDYVFENLTTVSNASVQNPYSAYNNVVQFVPGDVQQGAQTTYTRTYSSSTSTISTCYADSNTERNSNPETEESINAECGSLKELINEDEFDGFLSNIDEEIVIDGFVNMDHLLDEQEEYVIEVPADPKPKANCAMQQLASETRHQSRPTKTIMFLGDDSKNGKTIQKMSVDSTKLKCKKRKNICTDVLAYEENQKTKKQYQCDNCEEVFVSLFELKDHIGSASMKATENKTSRSVQNYVCPVCNRLLRSDKKISLHKRGHGDTELECKKCLKVFATRFILKGHFKNYHQTLNCEHCKLTFDGEKSLKEHKERNHPTFSCDKCHFHCFNCDSFLKHKLTHKSLDEVKDDINVGEETVIYDNEMQTDNYVTSSVHEDADDFKQNGVELSIKKESVGNKEKLAHDIFKMLCKDKERNSRGLKLCQVCNKSFDRHSDLKRHLIEHIVQNTLSETPVSANGKLSILCNICLQRTFHSVDRYKAHLREHAKLTLYECKFCKKSFSDSSNFSKHKKVHGVSYLQCDLCRRKFSTKKMLTQHMIVHINTDPLYCEHCNKEFYFWSTLKKHIKSAHNKQEIKFRCTFCKGVFKSSTQKIEHEWQVHKHRKIIIDCDYCNSKFRKQRELKKHILQCHSQ